MSPPPNQNCALFLSDSKYSQTLVLERLPSPTIQFPTKLLWTKLWFLTWQPFHADTSSWQKASLRQQRGECFWCWPNRISTISKHKEAIKNANLLRLWKKQWMTGNRRNRKLLLIWIKEKQLAGDSISEVVICEKSKMPHADFLKVIPLRLVGGDLINLRKEVFVD